MRDLLALTAELIEIPSVSRDEAQLAGFVEARLRAVPWLHVHRVDDNLVARTELGHAHRLLIVGHLDTVPANDNEHARIEGDVLWGLGAADMKGGIAVFLDLAETIAEDDYGIDVTYVFYACEEIGSASSGLGALFAAVPHLLAGDAAVLGEPTGGAVEAGCQGTMRLLVTMGGVRAHSARPWMGRNAIHRLGPLLALVASFPERRPVLDGCEYREALQAVRIEGGVAGNVVPDTATVLVNHRFAPDRDAATAEAMVRELLAPALEAGDLVELVESADGAAPGLTHPLLRSLVDRNGLEVRAKLGWTDVARFAAHGIPACNLGPGDPTLAHAAGEQVDRQSLQATRAQLAELLTNAPL